MSYPKLTHHYDWEDRRPRGQVIRSNYHSRESVWGYYRRAGLLGDVKTGPPEWMQYVLIGIVLIGVWYVYTHHIK